MVWRLTGGSLSGLDYVCRNTRKQQRQAVQRQFDILSYSIIEEKEHVLKYPVSSDSQHATALHGHGH